MGYVEKEFATVNDAWSIEILGTRYPARLQAEALFDPEGRRMRS
jgi:glycine cleavage system aminomethyltransferase T